MPLHALVIDDSFIFQRVMKEVLQGLDGVSGVDVAGNAADGLALIGRNRYDVVFLDMVLPDLDGLAVLERLRGQPAAPAVVVVSGAGEQDAGLTVRALETGALEFIKKPAGAGYQASVEILTREISRTLAVCRQRLGAGDTSGPDPRPAPAAQPAAPAAPAHRDGYWVTAIAVSTGGPEALARFVTRLPADYPLPVVMVQHMPPLFTESLARSLDQRSAVKVVEGRDGMVLCPGTVYVAPGGRHMTVVTGKGRPEILLNDAPAECNVRPAADVLFRSLAAVPERRGVLAVVMTGMGEDGKEGVRALKRKGCRCLAQSRETCVVYGMPRAVVEAGLADEVLPLDELAPRLTALAGCPTRIG